MNLTYACLALNLGWNELKTLHWALQRPEFYVDNVRSQMGKDGWRASRVPLNTLAFLDLREKEAMAWSAAPMTWRQWLAQQLLVPAPAEGWCVLELASGGISVSLVAAQGRANTALTQWCVVFASGAYPRSIAPMKQDLYTCPADLYQVICANLLRMRKSCESLA
jgi:hypothetical protein